jgi:hypothetical protein
MLATTMLAGITAMDALMKSQTIDVNLMSMSVTVT